MRRLLLVFLFAAVPAHAEQISLLPGSATVAVRAYGLGFFPLDGNFTRFQGLIRYDPIHPQACRVTLAVDATSLAMSDKPIRDRIAGPEFMDVSRYPDVAFDGTCQAAGLIGSLRLHGETHPLDLHLTRDAHTVTVTGRLRRGDWGMKTESLLAGSIIRIQIQGPNPLSSPRP